MTVTHELEKIHKTEFRNLVLIREMCYNHLIV